MALKVATETDASFADQRASVNRRVIARRLDLVTDSLARQRLWWAWGLVWAATGLLTLVAAITAQAWPRSGSVAYALLYVGLATVAIALACTIALASWRRRLAGGARAEPRRQRLHSARQIERAFPDLDCQLLAAAELLDSPDPATPHAAHGAGARPDGAGARDEVAAYLSQRLLDQASQHARAHDWLTSVPTRPVQLARGIVALSAVVVCLGLAMLVPGPSTSPAQAGHQTLAGAAAIAAIEPGDVEVERGTDLPVRVRYRDALPPLAELVWTPTTASAGAENSAQTIPLLHNLSDPILQGRIERVASDGQYLIRSGDETTRPFNVRVYELPQAIDWTLTITPPAYAGQAPRTLTQGTVASMIQGSRVTVECRTRGPAEQVRVIPADADSAPLNTVSAESASTNSPAATGMLMERLAGEPDHSGLQGWKVDWQPEATSEWQIVATDARGRPAREAPQFRLVVVPNQPPELRLRHPKGDATVSPVEELAIEGTARDDIGLVEAGVVLEMPGQAPIVVPLVRQSAAGEAHAVNYLADLERLEATPNSLLAFHLYADDIGPDGQLRRTESDMYFAEVRPFEELFREAGGSGGQASGQGMTLEKILGLQKQVVIATWNLLRAHTGDWTAELEQKGVLIRDSEQEVAHEFAGIAGKFDSLELAPLAQGVTEALNQSVRKLNHVVEDDHDELEALRAALASEQAAYERMLRLRSRENSVRKSEGGGGSGSSESSSKEQLSSLELKRDPNRYESQQAAREGGAQQAREELAILDQLKELAQRQQALVDRLKELAQEERMAASPAAREEVQQELKRLRDEQQELLAESDAVAEQLRQREDDAGQLSRELDQSRQDQVDATQHLEEQNVANAVNAGTRAAGALSSLEESFRKQTSARLSEALRDLQAGVDEVLERERELAEKVAASQPEQNSSTLRRSRPDAALANELREQRRRFEEQLAMTRGLVTDSETSEALLSEKLYDAVRNAMQGHVPEELSAAADAIDTEQLDRAQTAEAQAREGMERFAGSLAEASQAILGDEVEALRRAREQLRQLTAQLDQGQSPTAASGSERQPGDGQQAGPGTEGQSGDPAGQGKNASSDPSSAGASSGQGRQGQDGNSPGQPGAEGEGQGQAQGESQGQGQGEGQGQGQGEGQGQGSSSGSEGSSGGAEGAPTAPPGDGASSGTPGSEGSPNPNSNPGSPTPSPGGSSSGGQQGGNSGGPGANGESVFTGGSFSGFNDSLRELETMLDDPALRSQVQRVRGAARGIRSEFNRHARRPDDEKIDESVRKPLQELRKRIEEELAEHEPDRSLAPLERDEVPARYREVVRGYYERLGSGDE